MSGANEEKTGERGEDSLNRNKSWTGVNSLRSFAQLLNQASVRSGGYQ
jgi:hypothetical protein